MAQAFHGRGMNVVFADLLDGHLAEAREALGRYNGVHCIRIDIDDRVTMREAARGRRACSTRSTCCATMWAYASATHRRGELCGLGVCAGRKPGRHDQRAHGTPAGMKAHGQSGHVVNTSSMAGMIPMPPLPDPCHEQVRGQRDERWIAAGAGALSHRRIGTVPRNGAHPRNDRGRHLPLCARGGRERGELRSTIEGGLDPAEVGELVVAAIERNGPTPSRTASSARR
jgi:prepilin-type processing-associated H-X9-DG protein